MKTIRVPLTAPFAALLFITGSPALLLAGAASADTTEVTSQGGAATLRPFLFNEDARIPGAMQVTGSSRLTFSPGGGRAWPLGLSPLSAGDAVETLTELGLGNSFSVQLSGLRGDEAIGASGGRLGLRWAPIASRRTRVVFSGGVLQQLTGTQGAWGTVAVEQGLGPVRVASSVQAQRVFAGASEAVDMLVTAGADVSLGRSLRAGFEYAARDLEEISTPGSEGGPGQIIGAVFGLRALDDKLALSAGPALALGAAGLRPVGRVALLWSF